MLHESGYVNDDLSNLGVYLTDFERELFRPLVGAQYHLYYLAGDDRVFKRLRLPNGSRLSLEIVMDSIDPENGSIPSSPADDARMNLKLLMSAFLFTPEDLKANRAGEVTEAQRKHIGIITVQTERKKITCGTFVVVIPLVLTILLLIGAGLVLIEAWRTGNVGSVAAIGGLVFVGLLAALLAGAVFRQFTGPGVENLRLDQGKPVIAVRGTLRKRFKEAKPPGVDLGNFHSVIKRWDGSYYCVRASNDFLWPCVLVNRKIFLLTTVRPAIASPGLGELMADGGIGYHQEIDLRVEAMDRALVEGKPYIIYTLPESTLVPGSNRILSVEPAFRINESK